jgi:hypothetical protein
VRSARAALPLGVWGRSPVVAGSDVVPRGVMRGWPKQVKPVQLDSKPRFGLVPLLPLDVVADVKGLHRSICESCDALRREHG